MSMSMSMSSTSSSASGSTALTSKTSTSGTNNAQESVQEYSIRVPKNGRKKFHLMRFNATLNVDFAKWTNVKMERENNQREFRGMDEDQPKFGAGSEFGRDAREEARRKKMGFIARKYKSEDQPWLLRSGGKTGKKFKGIREGGVSENASYYVFTHAADGAIEAFPLQEWYNFTPIQCYKALSAEEAEQEFGKRNRVLNFFSLMMRKRLRGDDDLDGDSGMGGVDGDDIKLNGGSKSNKSKNNKDKELKISEMDEWMDTSSDDDDSNDEDGDKDKDKDKDNEKQSKNSKQKQKKKKKQRDTDAEAFEDSDDGDDEGRELDYISSSSESDVDIEKQLQGVAEEKALRKLLTSDEDSDDDENKSNKSSSDDEKDNKDKDGDDKKNKDKDDKDGKDHKDDGHSNSKNKHANKKKASQLKKKDFNKNKNNKKDNKKESSSSLSSDSDSDNDNNKKKAKETSSNNNSRSSSPITSDNKRKFDGVSGTSSQVNAKKQKMDMPAASLPTYLTSSSDSGITEDAVRRYLMRKPMTTTELLQKFKTKKTGLNSEQLVNIMTQILKKINPVKQTIKGKMYLSIKQ